MNLQPHKYKILILSNPNNYEHIEDLYIANSFKEDGHFVEVLWIDYDEQLDNKFDIIIRRNTWVEDEKDIYSDTMANLLNELMIIKQDIDILNKLCVRLIDINKTNIVYNGKLYLIDPGNYYINDVNDLLIYCQNREITEEEKQKREELRTIVNYEGQEQKNNADTADVVQNNNLSVSKGIRI